MGTYPVDFVWGTASSAYQIEGAWLEGGRGLTIWDAFSHTPGRIRNDDTGDVACDHYHRYREDVRLMRGLGVTAYRFSIAWSRIQPAGSGNSNPTGIRFYSDLIDELLSNGIEPWVTLYHWDLPLALQMECDGWLNPMMADYFADYARICFEMFGTRVKRWITLNEPWVVSLWGHARGTLAPGRTSLTEPYRVAHNLLRAHAKAVRIYHDDFVAKQGGRIGIVNNCEWREPRTGADRDVSAAQRALEFFLGWFADPIYRGDYPETMRQRLGARLPKFSADDAICLRNSTDFFGLNHYQTYYASEPTVPMPILSCFDDPGVELSSDPAWEKTDMGWNVVPEGIRRLLCWVSERYGNPEVYITENGCAAPEPDFERSINDDFRVRYLDGYLRQCLFAIEDKVNLRGYFVWSLLDNFEWQQGTSMRFGLHHVDYSTLVRTPKKSARWYREFIQRQTVNDGAMSESHPSRLID